jgi:NTP pyrophosphatase (non-canonical NTP hydrolase)
MTVMPPAEGAPTVENAESTVPWKGEPPLWLICLYNYAKARSKAPLDLQGVQVPKRIQVILERASVQTLEQIQQEVFEVNNANGWFDSERTVGDDIALLHSEVTEMFEAYRDHGFDDVTRVAEPDEVEPSPIKPEGFGSEAADVLIRLVDTCRRYGIDLRAEYVRKIAFNRTRGYRHGGRKI